jgi:hypothetical protein
MRTNVSEPSEPYSRMSALDPPHEEVIREFGSDHSEGSEIDPKKAPTFYVLTIRAKANGIPVANRLRQLLKIALRAFDLRCIDVKQVSSVAKPAKENQ